MILAIIFGVVLTLLVIAVVPLYLGFVKPPNNNPNQFLKQEHLPKKNTVVFAGDSLTHASLSYDFLRDLEDQGLSDTVLINAGHNGDTAEALLRRSIHDIIDCQPDVVVILIGTNDVRVDTSNAYPQDFMDTVGLLLETIHSRTRATLALVSLPPLGEQLDTSANRRVGVYNQALRALATSRGITYIPFYENIEKILRESHAVKLLPFEYSNLRIMKNAYKRYLLHMDWPAISKSNGLVLSTDQVHIGEKAGQTLVDLLQVWLNNLIKEASHDS